MVEMWNVIFIERYASQANFFVWWAELGMSQKQNELIMEWTTMEWAKNGMSQNGMS